MIGEEENRQPNNTRLKKILFLLATGLMLLPCCCCGTTFLSTGEIRFTDSAIVLKMQNVNWGTEEDRQIQPYYGINVCGLKGGELHNCKFIGFTRDPFDP